MKTPVLLIAFNRPNYTRQMLNALKISNVENLLIFRDGPRPMNSHDQAACQEVKNLVEGIDWKCSVKTNFMNNNLGCGWGPFSAISWAFQYTDRLIILEDDCIPTPAFFRFCEYLLEKYKDNDKVRHISGYSQFPGSKSFSDRDYIFTQYAPTLGWATWKRVWDNCDMHERIIQPFFKNGGFTNQFATKEEAKYFNDYYWRRVSPLLEATHSWDYQYAVHSKINGALSIVPAKNLIQYIGIEGTHPSDKSYYELKACSDFSIQKEPTAVELDKDYEMTYFKKYCTVPFLRKIKFLFLILKNKIWGRPDYII